MKYSFLPLVILVTVLMGCGHQNQDTCAFVPDTKGTSIDLVWESLEDSLPAISSKQELVSFFSDRTVMREVFFNREAFESDSAFINERYNKFSHPAIDSLLMDVHQVFGDGSRLKEQFEEAFKNFQYYYPEFQPPKIQTVLTGLEVDLFVSDTLVIISLDHYLGNASRFKPNMYDYMKKRFQPDFIVPSVMLMYGIDNRYNNTAAGDRTVLADMIAYGKAYLFAKSMVPCMPDSVLIGYTAEEMMGARKNESLIWSRLVEDQIFFSTNNQDKQKYISERPKTLEVGEKCPGRIGQWVGWQIMRSYEDQHTSMKLPDIMKLNNASEIFRESGYKPQLVKVPSREKI